MLYDRDIDHELSFDDDRAAKEPSRIRNAYIVDGLVKQADESIPKSFDNVTAWAAATSKARQFFSATFETNRGKRYSKAVKEQLHHQKQYRPCTCMTPEEYEACKGEH